MVGKMMWVLLGLNCHHYFHHSVFEKEKKYERSKLVK
jgi:hypothetical protein